MTEMRWRIIQSDFKSLQTGIPFASFDLERITGMNSVAEGADFALLA